MATLLLSAAGAAIGSGFGGTVLGLSGAVVGRAVGATLGRVIDQRVLGAGADPVETGRLDRIQIMGAGKGAAVPKLWGRMKIAGQVIWASPYLEARQESGGGKGMPRPKTVEYSYTVSLAIALCEGPVTSVGRIWADSEEIAAGTLDYRLYPGDEVQLPDPAIEADLGEGNAPAYRGTAYVVFENLDLSRFGNRVPQFAFEVTRRADEQARLNHMDMADCVPGVALIPGTGEYALATQKVRFQKDFAMIETANAHSGGPIADFPLALSQLSAELPEAKGVSLVVSWFGDDLRCDSCQIMPKVEQVEFDGMEMPWRAGGIGRAEASVIPKSAGRSIYGGTPADASVIQAITALNEAGKDVMFYPFILMDQLHGNGLADPYGNGEEQPVMPWRGRITTSVAAGQPGSPDRTALASAEVDQFFGAAQSNHFSVVDGIITYSGPSEWGYRRFILHYAHLCALAGGVEAFCIGSELRGLTQIRGENGRYPAVDALIELASDVRAILGPSVKISYAADWSEYFGHHSGDDVTFHLDALWADPNIDFIGVDNYMPLSDWRDGEGHADAHFGSIYNLDYLTGNVAGGEYYDWYYDSAEGVDYQRRRPISDDAYGESWIYRPKDFLNWWTLPHHNRVNGVRSAQHTAWVPQSKPIRFTEFGCAALNKATNEPNRFLDGQSSESGLPRASSGRADEFLQLQYFRAMRSYWSKEANNPTATSYSGRMVEFDKSYAWAWDARPFPYFPLDGDAWSDAANYPAGHWLNGRSSHVPLDACVSEVCLTSEVAAPNTDQLAGLISGYLVDQSDTARAILQPLSITKAFDAIEDEGELQFRSRGIAAKLGVSDNDFIIGEDGTPFKELTRLPQSEAISNWRLGFVAGEGLLEPSAVEISTGRLAGGGVAQADYNLQFAEGEARAIVTKWLIEAKLAQDRLAIALPPSRSDITVGTVIESDGVTYRVDRMELTDAREIEAVRVDLGAYEIDRYVSPPAQRRSVESSVPITMIWADLPQFRVDQPLGPVIAAVSQPWKGEVAVWASDQDNDYTPKLTIDAPATIGITLNDLAPAKGGLWDRGHGLQVKLAKGQLQTASAISVLNGRNLLAIGDGSADGWEIFGFQTASLIGNGVYEISGRLRGLAGTDPQAETPWPAGSKVILLSAGLPILPISADIAGVERHYRTGLAELGYGDVDTVHHKAAYTLNMQRPYRICHLRHKEGSGGELSLTWVRRGRVDSDSWIGADVPLGEESESYLIRFCTAAGVSIRQETVGQPHYSYSAQQILEDIGNDCAFLEIAQVSQSFGPGPAHRFDLPF